MNLQQLKKELLKNEEFRAEYEKYDLAFEVAKMLFEARMIKGVTQHKLAEMINAKQSGIARVESGRSLPSLSFLEKIAKAFKTTLVVKFGFMEDDSAKFRSINTSVKRSEVYSYNMDKTSAMLVTYLHQPTSGRRYSNA